MKNFRSLIVWQKSHQLSIDIYKLTNEFPKSELYGLTSQIRRAISSVPTNIAEGCGRGSDKEFSRFIQNALGSASEASYLLLLSADLSYISNEVALELNNQLDEVIKMLIVLQKSLKQVSFQNTNKIT